MQFDWAHFTPWIALGGGMTILYSLLAGLVFGSGLLLSGLADPGKVLAFLDLAGARDPSLLFVMGGALLVAAPSFAWLARRGRTRDGAPLRLPAKGRIDRRLVLGSPVFGAGWGLALFALLEKRR